MAGVSAMTGELIALAAGFLAGSIPSGYLLVRLTGHGDVREAGSGNIGATNVGRVLGRIGWVTTLLADAVKGAVPVLLARALIDGSTSAAALAAFGAILGHCYTPWLGGRGGKGVATMLGTFGVLAPWPTLTAIGAFLLVAFGTGYASAASLLAVVVMAAATWGLGEPMPTVMAAIATVALVGWRHRGNIRRLREGTESRTWGGGST